MLYANLTPILNNNPTFIILVQSSKIVHTVLTIILRSFPVSEEEEHLLIINTQIQNQ